MRWLGRALAGSVAVHAAIAVAASRWHAHRDRIAILAPPPDATVEVSSSEAAAAAPVPIELVTMKVVPPESTSDVRLPTSEGRSRIRDATRNAATGAHGTAISTGHTTATETATTTTGSDTGSRLLSMRDPIRRPDAAGTASALEQIAEQGEAPPPIPDSGRLEQHGSETRIGDRTFTATVDPDGTVHIEDKPNFNAHIAVPKPKDMGKAIADWAEDPYGYQKRLGVPLDAIEQAPRGDRARVTDTDQKPDSGNTVPLVGGGFDVTDWISRKALGRAKGDPYAARKLAALDATRDERAEMRRRHRNDQLDHADVIVRDSLDQLWSSALSIEEKKEGLFELWDDCAETGDAPVVDAARRARNDIVGFVRAHLPAGSADAFRPDELDALNARRSSHARFAPYDDAR